MHVVFHDVVVWMYQFSGVV